MTLKYPTISKAPRRSPTNRTLWCGPFAIAMVTGLEYDEAYAKTLAHIRRKEMEGRRLFAKARGLAVSRNGLTTSVKGLSRVKLPEILKKLKVTTDFKRVPKGKRLTVLTFTRDHTVKGLAYIIVAGNHWMTIKDGILYHSHHDPIAVEDAPRYKMAKVDYWAAMKPRPEALVEA